ncbi:MAG: dockerin type I repeat-containing protein [Clostridia bacterium]|nr:dockerin type I repeat-containing protein [Clostridia bacterium]
MKNSLLKKMICVLLSMLMLLSMPLSSLAAKTEAVPVIYVGEIAENALYKNPMATSASTVFDINSSGFTSAAINVIAGLFVLSTFEDSNAGVGTVMLGANQMLEPIRCAPDGTSYDKNVSVWEYTEPVSSYKADSIYTEDIKALASAASEYISEDEIFFFSYDWRLDPLDAANKLRDYIDNVEKVTGSKKVSLLSVGSGGTVVNSYLYTYAEHAEDNIASCILFNTSILGNAIIGDFMKGRIARIAADEDSFMDVIPNITGEQRGQAMLDFIDDDSMGLISGLIEQIFGEGLIQQLFGEGFYQLVELILKGQDVHKTLGKGYNNFALNQDDKIYDTILRGYLRNMPGLWALVPAKDFDEAMDFMFEDEPVNEDLLDKLYNYRDVIDNTAETLKKAQYSGINVCVVSGYGLQLLPATISLADMSDSIESVKYSSIGAVTLDNSGDRGHSKYCINNNHSHRAPGNDIDAAYCVLPENTWFIEELPHGSFSSEAIADFLVWLLFGSGQRHIRENAEYTQYMTYTVLDETKPNQNPDDIGSQMKIGDINSDGDINAKDARLALRIAVELETATKEMRIIADVDGDGKVRAEDARLILRYAVGLINGFPA